MSDITDLRGTIVPKSDQLNAEQLLSEDMTITVTDVRMGNDEQPVIIHYENDNGRPFKPSKTVRKILIFAWGEDGRNWIGKSMTLFNDQTVRFGGMTVGGIRVSHLSDIESEIAISLTATRGKKAQHTIHVLHPTKTTTLAEVLAAIAAATDGPGMVSAQGLAKRLTQEADIKKARDAYGKRLHALKAAESTSNTSPEQAQAEASTLAQGAESSAPAAAEGEPTYDYPTLLSQIQRADSIEALDLIGDGLRDVPEGNDRTKLDAAYQERRAALTGE